MSFIYFYLAPDLSLGVAVPKTNKNEMNKFKCPRSGLKFV